MVWQMLWVPGTRKALKEYAALFKKDPNYSLWRLVKAMNLIIRKNKITRFGDDFLFAFIIPPITSPAFRNFLASARDQDKIFSSLAEQKKNAPMTFSLALTDRCICQCWYCSNGDEKKPELTTDQWKSLISQIQKMGTSVISFTGGEPLLRDDIEDLVRSVDERSQCFIYTSGWGLTLEKAENLKACGLYGVSVSLDSAEPEVHIKHRGHPESFEFACEAIKNASLAGLYPIVTAVLDRQQLNKPSVLALAQMVETLGAQELSLMEPIPVGRAAQDQDSRLFSAEDRKLLVDLQDWANKKLKLKVNTEILFYSDHLFGCAAGVQHSYLSSSGELYPCDFFQISFGNASKLPLAPLWRKMNAAMDQDVTLCLSGGTCDTQKTGGHHHNVNACLTSGSCLDLPEGTDKSECITHCLDKFHQNEPKFFKTLTGSKKVKAEV